jgi:hypothetical protein
MTDRELLQQALDSLEWAERRYSYANLDLFNKPIEALRTRLAQPEPEPVGCITEVHTKTSFGGTVVVVPQMYGFLPIGTMLYTAPPKKEWEDVSDAQLIEEVRRRGFKIKNAEIQKKEWVGLTDKEMFDCLVQTDYAAVRLPLGLKLFAESIEAKLKEKNT